MGIVCQQRTRCSRRRQFETLEQRHLLAAGFHISEFMASNDDTIDDEDGTDSDWIEITNVGDATGSLDGWYLTDDADRLTKWRFPNVGVAPGEQLLVWASDKERNDPAAPLHTNFKLKSGGEYLALVEPDGQTVVSEYAPSYPRQFTDISYGISTSTTITEFSLVASSSSVTARVPDGDALNLDWTMPDFDDST